ncbi:ankyrin repeat domain-containing protein [Sphingomonas sp. LHG3406-1]|uniref:ankyrin repeat domain-containing protein n=1 Tax=Sphingomonas sp. LHG3406-1 TaxID=2804617 RepID=UPI002616B7B3|nr:ankyrin repeat domain-containing protein [Sphingomonas sp. LHG3406-1]
MAIRKLILAAAAAATLAVPAAAQFASQGYTFIQAVRQREGDKAIELLKQPGSNVVNYRDDSGEAAIHVVTGRRDLTWLRYLLAQGADANLSNRGGDTALIIAARIGFAEGADALLRRGAQVDKANRLGETPLIVAVQQRQMPLIRLLVDKGANPDKTDNATGRSARDYAKRDARAAEMLRLMEATKPAPARPVAGPGL